MSAESILDLIDVKFQDATNHVSFTSDDLMGMVMPYYWGEADKIAVYDRTTFNEMFPESLPIGVAALTDNDRGLYSGYAQAKAYFAHGGGQIEIYRPAGDFKYQQVNITSAGVISGDESFIYDVNGDQFDDTAAVSIALKYAGFVPQSLAPDYTNIGIKIEPVTIKGYAGQDKCIKIIVQGLKPAATGNTLERFTLEEFEGSGNPLANVDGESIYLEKVVKSNFIAVKANGTINSAITAAERDCIAYSGVTVSATNTAAVKAGYKYFRDFESSNATLLINPFVDSTVTDYENINGEMANAAAYRKNCMAVFGYPVNLTYDYTNIEAYFVSGNNGVSSDARGNKFCIALQGREIISLFGYRYTLNCTAGYCGKMVNVAKEAHLNQIASGYVYGLYGGSLKESLLSGPVIDLMELGINSVYTSKRGNIIWGTRTMYGKQTSYFGKTNVMRVCSAILKNIFPICIETLHTDAASNPITRASFSTALNSILDTYIANQDLQPDSYADCSDSINTDYLTKGGTILNVILNLHFIGLVERISIKIIATDTSVSAEFV